MLWEGGSRENPYLVPVSKHISSVSNSGKYFTLEPAFLERQVGKMCCDPNRCLKSLPASQATEFIEVSGGLPQEPSATLQMPGALGHWGNSAAGPRAPHSGRAMDRGRGCQVCSGQTTTGMGPMRNKEIQISSYKINRSQGCSVQHKK